MSSRIETDTEGRILTQYAGSDKLRQMIVKTVGILQDVEDSEKRAAKFASLELATGAWLDILGRTANVYRTTGESDDAYRARIIAATQVRRAGTPDYAIERASAASGDTKPVYFEEEVAAPVAFIFTPNGRQLARSTVDALMPAGVTGVPGARIMTADGKRIVAGFNADLTDDEENILTDADGEYITGSVARSLLAVAT